MSLRRQTRRGVGRSSCTTHGLDVSSPSGGDAEVFTAAFFCFVAVWVAPAFLEESLISPKLASEDCSRNAQLRLVIKQKLY